MAQTSVATLFEANQERLALHHLCGNLLRLVVADSGRVWPADLVGHLNLIHPERIQVLGLEEIGWAQRQPADKVRHHVQEISAATPPAMVVADGCPVPEVILDACQSRDIALFSTPREAASVIDTLRAQLSRTLGEHTSVHGVFMDVLGLGVLITGDSGVGKSELALELISRGHGLVADDVVEIARVGPNTLEGRSPELLRDFLEVRGLGILNIRTIFGETACRRRMRLKLAAHLERARPPSPDTPRLPLEAETQEILGAKIRRVTIPVAAGRNIAVLLEAAVRTTILQLRGINSTQEFVERQRQALSGDDV